MLFLNRIAFKRLMKIIIHIILFCLYTPALLGQNKEYHRVIYADSVIFEDTTLADSAIYGPHWLDIYEDLKYYADNIRSAKTDYIEGVTPWGSPWLYYLFCRSDQDSTNCDTIRLRRYFNVEPKMKKTIRDDFGIANLLGSITKEDADSMYFLALFDLSYTYSGKLYKAKLKYISGSPEIIEKRNFIDYHSLLNRVEVIEPAYNGEYPVHWLTRAPFRFGRRLDYPMITIKKYEH